MDSKQIQKLSAAGVLVSLGIIYGDIGTSPLYVFKAIMGQREISETLIYGGLSCVFWTLTLVTTLKYVYLALNADNKGEGGIFALYALVRKYKAGWVIYPAIIGCATMIADGFITPAISVTSAIEGLNILYDDIPTVPIVITIIVMLFVIQQFGTGIVGKLFGPVMLVWFAFIGGIGLLQIMEHPEVLKAVNPVYAVDLLAQYPGGFWVLSAVFLCTTGAEAMYSDLGHCGKPNIRVGWVFVKTTLLLAYFGQGAWLTTQAGTTLHGTIPFFAIIPEPLLLFGVAIATLAAVIASQALISGTFTLVTESMKLKLWPATRLRYPSEVMGQIYIPSINWILMIGCIAVVLIFQESAAMEGAYGFAITFNMLMTTVLLAYYFSISKKSRVRATAIALVFFAIEGTFLVSNLSKFSHGGWFTFFIAATFFTMMFVLVRARRLRDRHTEFVDVKDYVEALKDVQNDVTIPKEASNLVYLAVADSQRYIDSNIVYSIFRKRPKRADVYWFLHVDTVDSPYTSKYSVDTVVPRECFFVRIKLGFKTPHRVNLLFSKIVHEMAERGEVDVHSTYPSLRKHNMPADFKFIVLHSWASFDSEISNFDRIIIYGYRVIKRFSLSTAELYDLEAGNIENEKIPISVGPKARVYIKRESEEAEREKEEKYAKHSER